jgi:hypothetical protein
MIRQPQKSKLKNRSENVVVVARPAPTKGWNTRDSKAMMDPRYALYLENWFPTPSVIQLRKGAANWLTGMTGVVKTLMPWHGTTGAPLNRILAMTDAGIFNATSSGAVGANLQVRTLGYGQYCDYTTTAGSYLITVNGTDDLARYDGTAFTTVANYAISGGGTLNTNVIINVSVFKRMLFFIEKASMNFYYLPVDSIAGTVGKFPLGGLFDKGGSLVAHGTWTVDAGEGQDDYSAFITSEGQVAIYRGTDPASAATWALVGVFNLGQPLGYKCFQKYGGDLLCITRQGIFPMAKAFLSATLNLKAAINDNIVSTFLAAAYNYGANRGWQVAISPQDSLLLVNIPVTEFTSSVQYVMNTTTGAWCRFTGWDAACFEILDNQLYMGMSGKVAKAWYGLDDFGSIISCYAKPAFDYFQPRGRLKFMKMVQPILTIQGTVGVDQALDIDFADGNTYDSTSFTTGGTGAVFDTGIWVADGGLGSVWAGDPTPSLDWKTLSAMPFRCAAPRLRVLSQGATVEWAATNYAFEVGGIV